MPDNEALVSVALANFLRRGARELARVHGAGFGC